ncbi:MAG: D-aminoacyl-tRNA deacylase [Acutalibacteraceae bacterium]|nr:D-aminoacyl-tRNA deacylase [Acutalibacteraceae bacterium]
MKIVLQRVKNASITVDGELISEIGVGYLILIGVSDTDAKADAERLARKIAALRIFEDENGKINRDINDVGGSALVVSQFTLYADCKKGNRPSFVNAGKPDFANEMYLYFADELRKYISEVKTGVFGADMKVSLLNDGPFTLTLE